MMLRFGPKAEVPTRRYWGRPPMPRTPLAFEMARSSVEMTLARHRGEEREQCAVVSARSGGEASHARRAGARGSVVAEEGAGR